MTTPHVLIVDDDAALLQALPAALSLRLPEVQVDTSDEAEAALEQIARTDYDAIVSDIKMPGMDGLALLHRVRTLRPDTPTLLITGHGEHDLAVQALRGGAYDFIQKPIDRDYFVASLARAIQMRQLSREVEAQRRALERHAETLEQTVRERTRELLEANRAKDELLAARDEALGQAAAALEQVESLARALGRHAAELNAIIEAMADGVLVCDADGRVIHVNRAATRMLGLSVESARECLDDAAGFSNLQQCADGTPLGAEDAPLRRALRGETSADSPILMQHTDGSQPVELSVSFAPIRDDRGYITGAVAVTRDVTELNRLHRQKDEFLSIASHELKTPLTSMKALTQIIRRRLERAGRTEAAHMTGMERSIARMELLVNDLLDISRIESGKLPLHVERCDVIVLCREIAEEQTATSARTLHLDLPAEPVEIDLDADRIGQVLSNLLSNAIKYSPPAAPIELTVRRDAGEVILAVRDYGPGIPTEELPHVFERFYRVPGIQVLAGSGVGLGLGLYICREIVERHGGRIWVESEPGQGSAFFVALPLTHPVAGTEAPAAPVESGATHRNEA
jgi:signal transduction histidine kinase/FixJ family two-component response regulator